MPALACAVAIVLAMAHPGANAASSGTVVSATVPGAVTVDTTGCPGGVAGITEFGTITPGSSAVTSADCVVGWGASNESSMIRAYQSDRTGTAMARADQTWTVRNAADSGAYYDVSAASASTAYVAYGDPGVRTTTNGGTSWTTVDPSTSSVTDVSVAPGTPSVAAASTSAGEIYRTTTTGASWPAETSGVATALNDVSLIDATNGFAVGVNGVVRKRTTGGGATWAAATTITGQNLTAVSSVNTNVAFVASRYTNLYRTGDGGATWVSSSCSGTYAAIAAPTTDTAYAVGLGGRIVRLTWASGPGTLSCAEVTTLGVGEDLLGVVAPTGSSDIWVTGSLGTLFHSADSGATWTRLDPGAAVDFEAVTRSADGAIWLAGWNRTATRAPTGVTFAVVDASDAESTNITDLAADDVDTVVAVGGEVDGGGSWQASIRTTTNGGTSWTQRTSATTNALFGVATAPGGLAIAVGDDTTIRRSTDSGATWSAALEDVAGSVRLWDVDMTDAWRGWAVGDGGTILRTVNGGVSWSTQASPVTSGLRAVSAVDKDVAFAVGVSGRILRTTNGGATWTSLASIPTTQPLDDVSAVDAQTVWVAFGYETVLRSTDANVATPTWSTIVTNSGQDSFSIEAVSRTSVFVGGAWSRMTRTTDGGATWSTSTLPDGSVYHYALDAIDENTAWTGGTRTSISRTLPLAGSAVTDYLDAGPNWSSGTTMFGACLRSWAGANVAPAWTPDATCTASGLGVWKGIATTGAGAGGKVAGATAATTATISLRFGMFVAGNQPPGRYSAGVSFEVIAPNA